MVSDLNVVVSDLNLVVMKAVMIALLGATWLTSANSVVLKQELQTVQEAAAQEQQKSDRFFAETFATQEAELLKLQQLSHNRNPAPPELDVVPLVVPSKQVVDPMAISSEMPAPAELVAKPMNKSSKMPASAELVAKPMNTSSEMPAPAEQAPTRSHTGHSYPAPPELNFKPMSASFELLPTLAMLKGLYEDGKDRIANATRREEGSKKRFLDQKGHHETKLADIKSRFEAKRLSKEFYDDELKTENKFFGYWTRVRTRQHKQFLSAVKIQHGTMKRVSKMIELYELAIAGKAPASDIETKLSQAMSGLPGGSVAGSGRNLVLIQDKESPCCDMELRELQKERAQFDDSP